MMVPPSRREEQMQSVASEPPAPVVTIASLYGAGGKAIGPRVAERLGVPFLDRAIPRSVAERVGLTEDAVAASDEGPRSGIDRLLSNLARVGDATTASGRDVERVHLEERRMRAEIEAFLAEASHFGGVVLGRGGAVVLRSVPGVLHVYLRGSKDDRIARVMELQGVDRGTAERRVRLNDAARKEYVRLAYGVDGEDPSLYHLMVETAALGIDACVALIVTASGLRLDQAARAATAG
jgi:cytidylate kinase